MRVGKVLDAGIKFLDQVDRIVGNTMRGLGPEISLVTININNESKDFDDERL